MDAQIGNFSILTNALMRVICVMSSTHRLENVFLVKTATKKSLKDSVSKDNALLDSISISDNAYPETVLTGMNSM